MTKKFNFKYNFDKEDKKIIAKVEKLFGKLTPAERLILLFGYNFGQLELENKEGKRK